jgi:hypothetical protein
MCGVNKNPPTPGQNFIMAFIADSNESAQISNPNFFWTKKSQNVQHFFAYCEFLNIINNSIKAYKFFLHYVFILLYVIYNIFFIFFLGRRYCSTTDIRRTNIHRTFSVRIDIEVFRFNQSQD